jgi:Ca-activated chloride channel homolog
MAQQYQLEQEERAKKVQQQQQQNEERYAALEPWMMHFQLGTLPEYYQQQQQQQEQQQQEQQQEETAGADYTDGNQVMIAIVHIA